MRMNEFEAYQNYLALKLHFTTEDYDYFKYNGKTNASLDSFKNRNDKYHFTRLSKKLDDNSIQEYFIANFVSGKEWVGDMDKKVWREWLARTQSIEYIFGNDAEKLLTDLDNFDIIFNCEQGRHPKLIRAYLGKKITLETIIIFEKIFHYRKTFDKVITEKIIWPNISRLIEKYEPFVEADISRCKLMLKEKVKEL